MRSVSWLLVSCQRAAHPLYSLQTPSVGLFDGGASKTARKSAATRGNDSFEARNTDGNARKKAAVVYQ